MYCLYEYFQIILLARWMLHKTLYKLRAIILDLLRKLKATYLQPVKNTVIMYPPYIVHNYMLLKKFFNISNFPC